MVGTGLSQQGTQEDLDHQTKIKFSIWEESCFKFKVEFLRVNLSLKKRQQFSNKIQMLRKNAMVK